MSQSTGPSEEQIILSLYQRGLSAPEISEETSIPSYRVRLLLKEQGVTLRGGKRNDKYFFLEQIRECLSKGLSIAETAALIERPYNTVLRWVREEGLTDQKTAQRQEAVRLHRDGQDARAIATALGMGHATILRWLHDAGEELKVPGRRPGYAPKKLQLFDRVKELHEQGLTVYRIAQDVGVHVDTVGIWLREEGIQPLYAVVAHSTAKGADPRTSPKREEGLRLYLDGYTETMISKSLDVPVGTVRSWVSRSGLQGKGGRAVRKDRASIRAVELHKQGEPVEKIARALKVSYYSVQNWLYDAGLITIRTAFGHCAGDGCEEDVFSPDHKFHSDECRHKNMKRRQPDPANWIETTCANPECPLPDGKFSYRKSQGHRYYHNDKCSQEHKRPVEQLNGLERNFVSLTELTGIGIERGAEQIPFGPRGSYAPDFTLTWQGETMHAETKGDPWIKGDTAAKHAAWRVQRGRLVMVFEDDLRELRMLPDAQAYWDALKIRAIEQG
jgi:transposase